jgi:hypothetical protein
MLLKSCQLYNRGRSPVERGPDLSVPHPPDARRRSGPTYLQLIMAGSGREAIMLRFIILSATLIIATAFYASGSANAARWCATMKGATTPDCRFATHHACIRRLHAGGGGRCHKME